MNTEIVINVDSLTKRYKLYNSHRDRVKEFLHPTRKKFHQEHYALKNISFSVKKGEVLGIIGQNGSGKSTLLKILASVVTPTNGLFNCDGVVTALLELGGGFDNDLTGIENIKFLAALQGFSKKEIPDLIKNILEFADIAEYAYQPVKSYSSGMYVRLAFSISINIDPDILIIDEALAVGDIRFQQKCYRKIREFKDQGKTIIFCTHSLSAVNDFCSRALWLHEGNIKEQGDPNYVTDSYNAYMTSNQKILIKKNNPNIESKLSYSKFNDKLPKQFSNFDWIDLSSCDSFGTGGCNIKSASILNAESNSKVNIFLGGEKLRILILLEQNEKIENPNIQVLLNGQFGSTVFKITNHLFNQALRLKSNKSTVVSIDFTLPRIGNGHYSFSFGILSYEDNIEQFRHWVHDALIIEIANPNILYKLGTQSVVEEAIINTISE
ncbi:MAG: ABC transporter ATP-binding protein [Bacteroidetes bacterium]|nr:ABC transporter ATP-binding protein [Bacteroidota bacterium]